MKDCCWALDQPPLDREKLPATPNLNWLQALLELQDLESLQQAVVLGL